MARCCAVVFEDCPVAVGSLYNISVLIGGRAAGSCALHCYA